MSSPRLTQCTLSLCPYCQTIGLFTPMYPGWRCEHCKYELPALTTGECPEFIVFDPQGPGPDEEYTCCPMCGDQLKADDFEPGNYISCPMCRSLYKPVRNIHRTCPECKGGKADATLHILEDEDGHWFWCAGCSKIFWLPLEVCPKCDTKNCTIASESTLGFLFRCPSCNDTFISRDEALDNVISGGGSFGPRIGGCDRSYFLDDGEVDWEDDKLAKCMERGLLVQEEL